MKDTIEIILNKLCNRLVITVLLIGIQMGWFALFLLRLAKYASWISILFTVLALAMALFIIWRDDNPAYKMGWILLIGIVPILGVTMYLLFGNKRPAKSMKNKLEKQENLHREELGQVEELRGILPKRTLRTVDYLANHGTYPAWTGTKTKYYSSGEAAYGDMLEDLKNAKRFIFMEYFIISKGVMWDEIYRILKEKAAEGVDVRIIYDDVGSINTIPRKFTAKLARHGIKAMAFNPLTAIVSLIYNNRDHRKITVIDGNIGYSGGYNVADEYINEVNRFGHWKDTGIRLEGKAVWNFTVAFLNMWNGLRKSDEDYQWFRPVAFGGADDCAAGSENCGGIDCADDESGAAESWEPASDGAGFESDGVVQPFSDTPLDRENVGENVYLEILSQAEDYVYIFTPYLIIDNEMQSALTLAAKRGVDVRLVTPGTPDKKMIFRLTRSYYRPLLNAGVRIFEYEPGFMHAKSYLSDDRIGVVGSINMDYRSLYLHFECGTLMIGCSALADLKEDCLDIFAKSREVKKGDLRVGFFGLLFDSLLRVLSPLL